MNMSPSRLVRIALCATALTAASVSFAQLTYTNNPAWDGVGALSSFGEGLWTNSMGQVFTADSVNTFMNSFTFHLRPITPLEDVKFGAYVAAWDGNKITGPMLYTSAMRTLPGTAVDFQAFTFDTGSLSLTGGAEYVAFLSTSSYFDTVLDRALLGFINADTFSGGYFVALNNGDDLSKLSSDDWFRDSDFPSDLAFTMEFSPTSGGAVPEPSTYGLIGALALLGLACSRRLARR